MVLVAVMTKATVVIVEVYVPFDAKISVLEAFSSTSIMSFGDCCAPAPEVKPFSSNDDASETGGL